MGVEYTIMPFKSLAIGGPFRINGSLYRKTSENSGVNKVTNEFLEVKRNECIAIPSIQYIHWVRKKASST